MKSKSWGALPLGCFSSSPNLPALAGRGSVYDLSSERMDIRFGLESYYGGLHCGTGMDVLIDGKWIPTRTPLGEDWYLVGIKTDNISGLVVRL